MKIVIASGTYPPAIGGMATFVQRLAQLLQESGVNVAVVAYGQDDRTQQVPYLVRLVSRKGLKLVRYWRYFRTVLNLARRADFIYAQDLVSAGFPAAVVSLVLRKKLVLRLGGDFLWEKMVEEGKTSGPLWNYYQQPKGLLESCYLQVYHFVLNRSQLVIFNSQRQADLYRTTFAKQLHQFKVIVNPWLGLISQNANWRKGNLVYAGRLIKLKNLDLLIRAYQRTGASQKLLLVGEGPQESNLRSQIRKLGLEQKILLTGPMLPEQLTALLAESYLMIVPSLTELNPNVVLEALSLGLPVLLTRENGLASEVNKELVTFDPSSEADLAEKLKFLLDENATRAYRKKIQNLRFSQTWEKVLAEHLQFFKSLL